MFSGIEQVQYFKVNTVEYPKQLPLLPFHFGQCSPGVWMWCSPVGNHFPPVFPAIKPGPGSPPEHMPWQKCHTKLLFIFMDIYGYGTWCSWIFMDTWNTSMDIYGLSTEPTPLSWPSLGWSFIFYWCGTEAPPSLGSIAGIRVGLARALGSNMSSCWRTSLSCWKSWSLASTNWE